MMRYVYIYCRWICKARNMKTSIRHNLCVVRDVWFTTEPPIYGHGVGLKKKLCCSGVLCLFKFRLCGNIECRLL